MSRNDYYNYKIGEKTVGIKSTTVNNEDSSVISVEYKLKKEYKMLSYFSFALNIFLIGVVINLYISNKNRENIVNKLFKEIDMHKEMSKYYKDEWKMKK